MNEQNKKLMTLLIWLEGLLHRHMMTGRQRKFRNQNTSLLLGEGLDKEETGEIVQLLRTYGDAIQLDSFEVHDYGPDEKDGVMVLSVMGYLTIICSRS